MSESYSHKMLQLENQFNEMMTKAEQTLLENDFQPSKDQCRYLQRAAMIRSEMAQLSTGAEREHHTRKVRELNNQIGQLVRVIDPEAYARKLEEARAAREGKAPGKPAAKSSGQTQKKSQGSDVSDEEVAGWYKEPPKHGFEEVSGMEDVVAKLRHSVESSTRQKIYDLLKIRKLKSYFFVGPPGCGKTHIIKAFAHELATKADYKYMSLVGSDILSKYVGDAEKIISRVFEEAEKQPTILFIDEIDGVCKSRSTPGLPEYASSLTTSFLTGYNRINDSGKPIIFIAATNYPTKVDSAMLDRVETIFIPFPDKKARAKKFRRELDGLLQLEEGFDYDAMSELTEGENVKINYRDMERMVEQLKMRIIDIAMDTYSSEEAAVEAIQSGELKLTSALFSEMVAAYMKNNRRNKAKELREWEDEMKESLDE